MKKPVGLLDAFRILYVIIGSTEISVTKAVCRRKGIDYEKLLDALDVVKGELGEHQS